MTNQSELAGLREKIQALLAEYAGLRAESINRNNNIFQLVAVFVVLIGLAASRETFDARFWFIALAAVLFSGVLGWKIHRDVELAAQRMQEIERQVNALVGEKVMVWESEWGGFARGFLRRLPQPAKPKDSN